jgi:parvulin-like peptidyl-prolyl isomerase
MFLIFFMALIITACAKHPPAAESVPPPAPETNNNLKKIVVAKVNGVDLNMDSLITMMNRIAPREDGGAPESLEEHKKRALDKLITQELAYQQAKAKGVTIGPDKIDMAIKNLRENIGGEQEYADYLAKQNVTESELRAEVERRLLIELDYSREVLAKVNIPDEEVRREYEKEKHRYILPEKISVIDVWVLKNEGKSSQKKAKELLNKIKAEPNQDPYKSLVLDGSFIIRDLKIQKGQKELYEAAKKLKPGELSGVVIMPNELHVIKLEKYSPERQATFDEVKDKVGLKFTVPAQEKRTRDWEEELKKDAKIVLMDIPVQEEKQEQQKKEMP